MSIANREEPPINGPVLATPQQLAAEKQLLKLLQDPEVRAAQAKVRAEMLKVPAASTPDGKARLDEAINQFTGALILHVSAGDRDHPQIISVIDNTPRSWFGMDLPGTCVGGDNPDNIYRYGYLDGAGTYEILGRVDPPRIPAQISFSIIHGREAGSPPVRTAGSASLMGKQVATLTTQHMQIEPDGQFRIIVGGAHNPKDANYMPLEPGPMAILVRDSMSDWKQLPARLTIRRLEPVTTAPRDDAGIRRRVLHYLPAYVAYWANFHNLFPHGQTLNEMKKPTARDGGWGYLTGMHYRLRPGEGLLFNITRGAAAYTGVHITDPWFVDPDGRRHQTSLNTAQTTANPDGSFTYIVSSEDPGVANWIDTAGMHEGYLLVRWQGLAPGASAEDQVHDCRFINLADLGKGGLNGGPPVSKAERQAQLKIRALQYEARYGE